MSLVGLELIRNTGAAEPLVGQTWVRTPRTTSAYMHIAVMPSFYQPQASGYCAWQKHFLPSLVLWNYTERQRVERNCWVYGSFTASKIWSSGKLASWMNHTQNERERLHLHVEAPEKWDLKVYSENDEVKSGRIEWLSAMVVEQGIVLRRGNKANVKMGDGRQWRVAALVAARCISLCCSDAPSGAATPAQDTWVRISESSSASDWQHRRKRKRRGTGEEWFHSSQVSQREIKEKRAVHSAGVTNCFFTWGQLCC